ARTRAATCSTAARTVRPRFARTCRSCTRSTRSTASMAGGRNHRSGALSDRKARIAPADLLAQQKPLARVPERCRVDDPVAKRTAIGTIAACDRAWNAHELGAHFITRQPYRRITVTAHVHERQVRGQVRIGNGVGALQVKAFRVFEARADAVL